MIFALYVLGVILTLICMSLVARFSTSSDYSLLLEAEEIAFISIFFPIFVSFILIVIVARLISG